MKIFKYKTARERNLEFVLGTSSRIREIELVLMATGILVEPDRFLRGVIYDDSYGYKHGVKYVATDDSPLVFPEGKTPNEK